MEWIKPNLDGFDEVFEFDLPDLLVQVSENPVVAELLGPRGEVVSQMLLREPIGFRIR
jgi:hypothetical protein